jgi:outer membrane protein TolC
MKRIPLWLMCTSLPLQGLSLEDYLMAVKAKHKGFQSSTKEETASQEKTKELELIFKPRISASILGGTEGKEPANPKAQGDKTRYSKGEIGLSQMTSYGLKWSVGYGLESTSIIGSNPIQLPTPRYYQAVPTGEVSLDLYRNRQGRETTLLQDQLKSRLKTATLLEQLKQKQILFEAESTYWALAVAQRKVDIYTQTVEQAKKLKSWVESRWTMSLVDRGDLLAIQTALKSRELELHSAGLEEVDLRARLNLLIEAPAQEAQTLALPELTQLAALEVPKRSPRKLDLLILEEQKRTNQLERSKKDEEVVPSLELFGKVSLNGKDKQLPKSLKESLWIDHPSAVIGIRWSMILGGDIIEQQKFAASLSKEGDIMALERRSLESQEELKELTRQFEDIKKTITLAQELTLALKEKVTYERKLHLSGRSTTFQVLSFEQEYLLSQSNLAGSLGRLMTLSAKIKLFEEDQT